MATLVVENGRNRSNDEKCKVGEDELNYTRSDGNN